MEWLAHQHALLSHLPVAMGLLLPFALLAAQRPGRGIRPWWLVCRYLTVAGLAGTLFVVLSGLAAGRLTGYIPAGRLLPPPGSVLLPRHALLGLASLPLAAAALWSMTRPRKDHESLGLLALALGLLCACVLLVAGEAGYRLAHGARILVAPAPQIPAERPALLAPSAGDPEARVPLRALDHASLVSIHADPVKSLAHGGRWIRAWANPEAASAYRAGKALPVGAFVVLSSFEDRWGRPGTEPGPLYALEMLGTGPALSFYWAQVPEDRRAETGGEGRAYWRGQNTHLEACRGCHEGGMADPAKRSRWRPARLVPEP